MKNSTLLFILLFLPFAIYSQQTVEFDNSSFEGTPTPHVVPAPWTSCYGSPDTQPGTWGVTQAPSDGDTYVSFLQRGIQNDYIEGASQGLNQCLTGGTLYQLTVDAAFSSVYNTAEPLDCYGSLQLVGGNSVCDSGEVLWQSGMITHNDWQTYTITFTPTDDWCYLTFSPYWISDCNGFINCMIDNINGSLNEHLIQITSPEINSSQSCGFLITGFTDTIANSIVIEGDFIGSPVNATLTSDTTWEYFLQYQDGISGGDTITATAHFANDTAHDWISIIYNLYSPFTQELCVVTVDTALQKNLVVWEKETTTGIVSYSVQKETNQNNVYAEIGVVSYDSLSVFVDTLSDPSQSANRYKILTLDTCGLYSWEAAVTAHKTIHLASSIGLNGVVNLMWNQYEGLPLLTYNIYRGQSISTFNLLASVASNIVSFTDNFPVLGANYYFIEAVLPDSCTPFRDGLTGSFSNFTSQTATSVSEYDFNNQVSISPNPGNGTFIISFYNSSFRSADIKLFDAIGQLVFRLDKNELSANNQIVINAGSLASGVYLIQIDAPKNRLTKKLVVTN